MIKLKTLSNKLGSESGALLMATTFGIFIMLSLFAFYLSRLVILESRNSGFHALDIKTRNLALTAMEHGLQSFKASRNPETIQGSFNRGTYTVVFDSLKTESHQTNLPYSHYTTMKSIAKINDVERNTRVILSTYPEAFCFSYYGNNTGSATFSESLGSITGDMFFNGDVNTSIVSSGIIYNPTGSGGTQLASPPIFPTLNTAEYESLLLVASALPVINSSSNYALNFDGSNDVVNFGDMNEFNSKPEVSVSFWFMRQVDKPNNSNHGVSNILFSHGSDPYNDNIEIGTDGANVEIYVDCANSDQYASSYNAGIQNNIWYHLAFTYNKDDPDGNEGRLYINGSYAQSWNHWGGNLDQANNSPVSIGDTYHIETPFDGYMDELIIWNIAISPLAINEIYNGHNPLDNNANYNESSSVAGYWNFNEGNGSTLSDLSGNGNNGTIYGATWVQISEGNQATSNTTINLSSYTNNEFLNNGDLTLSNVTVNGPGVFVVYGNLTLESNTIINKNIKIICSGNLTVSDSQLGTDLNSAVVIYSNGIATYTNSTIYGLSISNGSSITLNNTTFYGGILNYSSTFSLQGSTQITGSVVSFYSLDFQGGSTSVSKGSLPPFFRLDIGLNSIVVPGSYLEY